MPGLSESGFLGESKDPFLYLPSGKAQPPSPPDQGDSRDPCAERPERDPCHTEEPVVKKKPLPSGGNSDGIYYPACPER